MIVSKLNQVTPNNFVASLVYLTGPTILASGIEIVCRDWSLESIEEICVASTIECWVHLGGTYYVPASLEGKGGRLNYLPR